MKKTVCMILCLVWSIMIAGCSEQKVGIATNIYYVDSSGNALVSEEYYRQAKSSENAVRELLTKMKKSDDIKKMQPAIPKSVEVENIVLENQNLDITFSEEYLKLSKSGDLLLRAAVVQTVTQLSEVSYVSFYVGEEALKDSSGNAIGYMSSEDFVQNTGTSLKSYQETNLKLYFADKNGEKLLQENRNDVRYHINTSVEKLVVEQLMKGTSSDKRKATIPNTVKLLGVSVKDGICYVNFNSAFLTDGFNQKPEVAIYSIVNSIIANSNTGRVQILIDGSSDVKFKGTIDLSEPLSWQIDLIEE